MPTKPKYLIGELAKKANVNIQTVRYYERIKLFGPDIRKSKGNVRYYSENSLQTLIFIKKSQALGFQLDEVKELLAIRKESTGSCSKVKAKAEAKLVQIKDKIKLLKNIEKNLNKLIAQCDSSDSCSIIKGLEA